RERAASDARDYRSSGYDRRANPVVRGSVAQGSRYRGLARVHEEDGTDTDLQGLQRVQGVVDQVRGQSRPHDAGRLQVGSAVGSKAALKGSPISEQRRRIRS